MKTRNIGVVVQIPEGECNDRNCPFHGRIRLRGRMFEGNVVSSKSQKTATVSWNWKRKVPKYERYEKKRTRIRAHNPPCIDAKEGDIVKIMESRKLSKTKNFVIFEKIKKIK
ncbi:MAG TPA: 30S ribosomal protein S17 [Candidatus Nanoarchaeia archaeon]|nr:30S ribosomal protein S17 [Candidatus Nanoarchaeia archaeon]